MAPFVLKFKGNKSFSPLSQISDAEALTRTWKVCTKVASHLEQGQRLENLSWRLWFLQIALVQADNAKQKREFKKFSKGMGEKLDKDKGRSIHELQAPGFKRTDSTDKVRMRVGEMAQHRESGTLPPHLSANAAGANGLTNRDANYMKGMQYTFAVDPRVKPLNTTPSLEAGAGAGRGGGVMGKMRVKPMGMHPPPVPAKALKQQQQQHQQQQQAGQQNQAQKNGDGDTTMHAVVKNEHAMDVSEDHASAEDDSMQHDGNHAGTSVEPGSSVDDQLYSRHEEEDGEGTGHHTPTQHHMLPSHHPSALPYPPPPSTGPAAHALSNAFTGNSYNNGYSNATTYGNGSSYGRTQHINTQQAQPQHQAPPQPNIIRFPTIFSSDFGPTALLCAVPTANAPAVPPHFSFESLGSPSPSEVGMFQSFAALGNTLDGVTTIQSNVTTQGIYGPGGPPSASSTSGAGSSSFARGNGVGNADGYTAGSTGGSSGHPGIGIGMQTAGTGFDFGVPRPTFEFPIDDILKGELGEGEGGQNASTTGAATAGADTTMGWDTSNDMFSFVAGSAAAWGVQPAEIHSPGGTTPASGVGSSTMNQSVPLVTSPTRRAFSGHPTSARSPATNAYSAQIQNHQQQQQQQAVGQQTTHQAKANSTSPVSMTSGVKAEGYDGSPTSGQGTVTQSPQSVSGSTPSSMVSPSPSSAQMIATATPSGTVAGNAAGSVVPGNVGNTAPGGVKSECANCGATHTPLWRRGLNDELNCNACGLYCKLHKRARPKNLRTSHGDRAGNAWGTKTGETEMVGEPVQCHNCATMATPLWRKDDEGNTLCNACGLYLKLHGTRRPLSMKSDVIRKRSRHETEKRTSVSSIITVMTPSSNPQNSRRNSPTPPPSAGSSSSGPEQYVGGSSSASGVDPMLFPYEQDFTFSNETDYLSMGMGFGNDLSFTSFGGYNNLQESSSSNANNNTMNRNGLASPRSPTEVQHIVETTVTAGIENGGGHSAPNAKRRRMTIESSFSGSSFAHTTGGANSTHSSPTGLGQKGPNTSPPFLSLDATLNNVNNSLNTGNFSDQQNGAASPTRSTFGTGSPGQVGLTYDFYGYPIHPPLVPLHPPNLMHPHSTMWESGSIQHTPTQSSMNRARSQSHSHSPAHSRSGSASHSRSNSQHITMPLYLYDGGASSRAYETHNAPTPTGGPGANAFDSTEEELFHNLFGESTEDKRIHYGPTAGM